MVIGMVIFAGVGVATLLTIYVVPVAYMVLARNTGSPLAISKELDLLDKEAPDKSSAH
jgi:multidrug efflux pump